MDVTKIQSFLGWCAIIHIAMMSFWLAIFILCRDKIYKIHTKWFRIPEDRFDTIHYCGMGLYKLFIFLFFVIPYLVVLLLN